MSFSKTMQRVVIGTSQGKMATIGYMILLICIIVATIYRNEKERVEKTGKKMMSPWEMLLIFGLLALSYILSIYSINCMVLGSGGGIGCDSWAWVNAAIVVVFAVAVLLTAFFSGNWASLSVN